MKKRIVYIAFLGVVVTLLSSCFCKKKSSEGAAASMGAVHQLENTLWVLESFAEGEVEQLDKPANLIFEKGGRINGFSGCNNFGADTKIEKEVMSIQNVVATRRYCTPGSNTESALFNNFRKTNKYKIEKNKLKLYDKSKLILTFVAFPIKSKK